jgi:hypothetical protein
MNRGHQFLAGYAVNRWVEARSGDVFNREPTMAVAALQEAHFPAAERAPAIK